MIFMVHYNYVFIQAHMVGYLGCFQCFTFVSLAPANMLMVNQVTPSGDVPIHPPQFPASEPVLHPCLKGCPNSARDHLKMSAVGWNVPSWTKVCEKPWFSISDLIVPCAPFPADVMVVEEVGATKPRVSKYLVPLSPNTLSGWFLCIQGVSLLFPFAGGVWLPREAYVAARMGRVSCPTCCHCTWSDVAVSWALVSGCCGGIRWCWLWTLFCAELLVSESRLFPSVWVCYGCPNRVPHVGGFKTTEFVTVPESRVWDQGVASTMLPPETLGEDTSLLLPGSDDPRLADLSLQSQPASSPLRIRTLGVCD